MWPSPAPSERPAALEAMGAWPHAPARAGMCMPSLQRACGAQLVRSWAGSGQAAAFRRALAADALSSSARTPPTLLLVPRWRCALARRGCCLAASRPQLLPGPFLTPRRYGLVVLGNPKVLSKQSIWNALLYHFKENGCLVEGAWGGAVAGDGGGELRGHRVGSSQQRQARRVVVRPRSRPSCAPGSPASARGRVLACCRAQHAGPLSYAPSRCRPADQPEEQHGAAAAAAPPV